MLEILLTFAAISIGFVAITTVVVLKAVKQYSSQKSLTDLLPALAASKGYAYSETIYTTSVRGTYNDRNATQVLSGALRNSRNSFSQFTQIEDKGDRSIFYRTITEVKVPESLAHFVIKSVRVDRQKAGGSFMLMSNDDAIDVQGYFSSHFKTYAPKMDQQQLFVMLQPNAMELLVSNFTEYDIEVDGDSLLVYAYETLDAESRLELLDSVDSLVANMRLASSDVKQVTTSVAVSKSLTNSEDNTNELSRTAMNDSSQKRLDSNIVKKIIISVAFLSFPIIAFSISSGSLTDLRLLVVVTVIVSVGFKLYKKL